MLKWLRTIDRFRRYVMVMVVLTIIYLVWLVLAPKGRLGFIFLILEFFMHAMVFMFAITNWKRSYRLRGGRYSMRNIVDVYICTINEPLEILERAVKSAVEIEYPNKRVYVLDDGENEETKKLCEKYQCFYLTRGKKDVSKRPFKAANLNYALKKTFGSFILTLDADQIVEPMILDDILGYFRDSKVGYLTSKQRFDVPKDDFNNDFLFYEYMQPGMAAAFSPVSTGSGVVYRRSAIEKIGGFQEWNIVEDLYTSLVLNEHGYKGVYVAQAYTIGLAPHKLKNIYKQRGLWAQDSLRLLFFRNPLLNFKLKFLQRLAYFEVGYIYLVCGIFIPGIFVLDIISLLNNEPILKVGLSYLLFKMPSFIFILHTYNLMSHGRASTSMWTAMFPVYSKAILKALLYKKPVYKPTLKKEKGRAASDIVYVLPHLFLVGASFFAMTYNFIVYGPNLLLVVKLTWIIILFLIMFPMFSLVFVLSRQSAKKELVKSLAAFACLVLLIFTYRYTGFAEKVNNYLMPFFRPKITEVIPSVSLVSKPVSREYSLKVREERGVSYSYPSLWESYESYGAKPFSEDFLGSIKPFFMVTDEKGAYYFLAEKQVFGGENVAEFDFTGYYEKLIGGGMIKEREILQREKISAGVYINVETFEYQGQEYYFTAKTYFVKINNETRILTAGFLIEFQKRSEYDRLSQKLQSDFKIKP